MTPSTALAIGRLHSRIHRGVSSVLHRGLLGTLRRARPAGDAGSCRSTQAAPPEVDSRYILLVDTALPRPDRDSGSMRMQHMLEILRAQGHEVVLMGDDGDDDPVAMEGLAAHGIHVLTGSSRRKLAWLQAHRNGLTAAILSRHHAAGHWLPVLRRLAPSARIVFDSVDLHFLRERREAGNNRSLLQRAFAAWTRHRELRLFQAADSGWVVSQAEHTLLGKHLPDADIHVVSNIIDVHASPPGFAQRDGMLFIGGFRHRPNLDAVIWLIEDIFPRIHARLPHARLHLVGPDMPAWLAEQARRQPGIELHGHVPELAPLLDAIRIGLAPLRYGAGVKGKVNLALANGMPMVATAIAAEGMGLVDGHDILVADTADAFAEAACRLHQDSQLWSNLAVNGLRHMGDNFSRDRAADVMARCLPPP